MKALSSLFIFIVYCHAYLFAQNYIDYKPQYTSNFTSAVLDKIEYTPKNTIIYFNVIVLKDRLVNFFGVHSPDTWYIVAANGSDTIKAISVKNLSKNQNILLSDIKNKYTIYPSSQNNVYSCEIHFPKLPQNIHTFNLLTGLNNDNKEGYLHFFNIGAKHANDKNLGIPQDAQNRLEEFAKTLVPHFITESPHYKTQHTTNSTTTLPKTLNAKEDIACNENIILDKIKFLEDSDQFQAQAEAQKQLFILLQYMQAQPQSTVTIAGHTDIFGNAEKNLLLSKKRALKVQQWLSMKGIAPQRITIEYFGITRPLYPEGNTLNRRVEFNLKCKD